MEETQRSRPGWRRLVLRLAGGGLLVATGAVHLDLYLTGYRSIPTIGGLFLSQVIAAFLLGAAVLASAGRLVSAAAAGFALSTLGGYLLALRIGLFGFREVRTATGIVAGVIEVAAFAVLAVIAVGPGGQPQPMARSARGNSLLERLQVGLPGGGWSLAALSLTAAVLLSVSLALTGPGGPASSGALLEIRTIGGVAVVTNNRGFTLYWFVPDTSSKSNCNGTCAAYWPPVTGSPAAGPGVTGKLGTIMRSNGLTQATYDGHPVYTYIGDAAPGEANGNDIDLNGGLWHEMVASG
jgi:predicted lipoprotein with Yx(FWY)xxD motif